ncbi:MAG: hypothetical protein ACYDHP_13305 [Ferrimicrobium sp.]
MSLVDPDASPHSSDDEVVEASEGEVTFTITTVDIDGICGVY